MLPVRTKDNEIRIGRHFSVSFQRTLRIPDDGKTYPLPPGLGRFPILKVSDYQDRVPESWRRHGGVFIPMYQREAMWLQFDGAYWRPNAVKVGVGKINALSAGPWHQRLTCRKQDYVVVPDQPWLDGINAGRGYIRQFVAMPLGMGYTVEGQLTGTEEFGGVQIIVYDPKPGKFPESEPERSISEREVCYCMSSKSSGAEMGLGVGGKMRQKIYPDSYGIETWDENNFGRVFVHIVNSMMYREITGEEAPPTPIGAKEYATLGLPWFELYDESKPDIAPSTEFAHIKTLKDMDQIKGFKDLQYDGSIPDPLTVKLLRAPDEVHDGEW